MDYVAKLVTVSPLPERDLRAICSWLRQLANELDRGEHRGCHAFYLDQDHHRGEL